VEINTLTFPSIILKSIQEFLMEDIAVKKAVGHEDNKNKNMMVVTKDSFNGISFPCPCEKCQYNTPVCTYEMVALQALKNHVKNVHETGNGEAEDMGACVAAEWEFDRSGDYEVDHIYDNENEEHPEFCLCPLHCPSSDYEESDDGETEDMGAYMAASQWENYRSGDYEDELFWLIPDELAEAYEESDYGEIEDMGAFEAASQWETDRSGDYEDHPEFCLCPLHCPSSDYEDDTEDMGAFVAASQWENDCSGDYEDDLFWLTPEELAEAYKESDDGETEDLEWEFESSSDY